MMVLISMIILYPYHLQLCSLEPTLQGFDYAMTLDTDSYFPGPLGPQLTELCQEKQGKAGRPPQGFQ